MAGDDATSAEFAASYDDGARQALDTLAELTHAFIGLGRLLTASGANHRDAEAANGWSSGVETRVSSYSGGSLHEDDYVRVSPSAPPSCLGANPVSLGTVESWILDQVEGFVWPGADVDLLLDAGTAWRRAGAAVADLEAHCDIAAGFLEHQVSPEIPLALAALAELRSLVGDTADALVAVGTACEEYADAVRATHDRTRALLAEIGQMVVEGVAISAIVGGLTGGFGAGRRRLRRVGADRRAGAAVPRAARQPPGDRHRHGWSSPHRSRRARRRADSGREVRPGAGAQRAGVDEAARWWRCRPEAGLAVRP